MAHAFLKGGLFLNRPLEVRRTAQHTPGRDEHWHQSNLIQWARFSARLLATSLEPHANQKAWALQNFHSIPNGLWLGRDRATANSVMKKAIAAGLTKGVLDLRLDYAGNGFHGLYIEMKAGRNDLSEDQENFIAGAKENGYECLVFYIWQDAARAIVAYMNLSEFSPIY